MTTLDKINAAVDFLRAHGAKRDADCGGWVTESGDELASCPVESAEALRRELFRRDLNSGKTRTAITGYIEP